ncbi:glutathione S-transferase [Aerophototrophica crusticola]|uniref:glutathione transferase n=1 Tax=Aerophototrophica crusticola TaxID=1709002 RepID=A0A858R3P2_9PROT|nr:glutathione S-transferase [Rhodospirillaceae bacterium B3]
MIEVHHLNNSRSQRVLWLLEELGMDYKVIRYERDPKTNFAPAELKAIHPLGKSPVIREGELVLAESGAIVEYLVQRHGHGRLVPPEGSAEAVRYLHWMHFAEGSAMLPILLKLYTGRLGDAAAPLKPRIDGEIAAVLSYMEGALARYPWFAGEDLTAADIQMSFPVEAAARMVGLARFPNLERFLKTIQARPGYRRAIERGGPYQFDQAGE